MALPTGAFAVFQDVASAMSGVKRLHAQMGRYPSSSILEAMETLRLSGALHTSVPRALLVTKDRSSSARELLVYGYDECITQQSRNYLANRDTTIRLFLEGQALDAVPVLPVCLESTLQGQDVDDALRELDDMGLTTVLAQALAFANKDGFAFVYIDAPGAIDGPIPKGTKGSARAGLTPASFGVITAEQLVWPDPATYVQPGTPETRDPLLRHGIHSLLVDFTRQPNYDWITAAAGTPQIPNIPQQQAGEAIVKDQTGATKAQNIHGHRIYPITPDILAKSFVGRSLIDIIYDDLRNLRDTIFAQSAAQLQGDPIVLEVNTKEGYRVDDVDESEIAADLKKFQDGQSDVFSPMEGLLMKRLGAVKLNDPEGLVRILASRLSHASALPVNKILASSRGSEQATPEDRNDYETGLTRRFRRPRLEPVIRHCLKAKAHGGSLPARSIAVPPRLHWPDTRVVAPDTAALIQKNRSVTMGNALKAGRLPPRDIMAEFPINTVPIDPKMMLGSRRMPFDIAADGTPIPEPIVNVNEEVDPSSDIVEDDEPKGKPATAKTTDGRPKETDDE